MDVERQQGMFYQLDLFDIPEGKVRHCASGEGGTGSAALEESQSFSALTL